MNLNDLKKEIPPKWKIQSTSKYKPMAICVPYIDARDCEDILDEVCGPENWQDIYKEINGKLFCGISIRFGDEWVTKWDVGTSGNFEKEKSAASDSFKRACVKWGIGRFLYNMKPMHVQTNRPRIDGDKSPLYPVDGNNRKISDLTVFFSKQIKPDKKKDKIEAEKATSQFLDMCNSKEMAETDISRFELYLLNRANAENFSDIASNVFKNFELYYEDFHAERIE
jgi:hypothetical protein